MDVAHELATLQSGLLVGYHRLPMCMPQPIKLTMPFASRFHA